MEAIFDHAMVPDRFALGSGEALGVHQVDSLAAKAEGSAFNHVCEEKTPTEVGEGNKATELLPSQLAGKRKRGKFTEDEMLMLTNMSDDVNNIVNALR
jgi:hypothetical protein